jgi:hypothetical protein
LGPAVLGLWQGSTSWRELVVEEAVYLVVARK